jgi:hypothetical protein
MLTLKTLRVFSTAEITPGVTSVMIPHLAFETKDLTSWRSVKIGVHMSDPVTHRST